MARWVGWAVAIALYTLYSDIVATAPLRFHGTVALAAIGAMARAAAAAGAEEERAPGLTGGMAITGWRRWIG